MSALSRIRHNMGLIVIVIGVALMAFIMTDFFSGIVGVIGAPTDAGIVDGQTVSYQEFQRRAGLAAQSQGGSVNDVTRAQLNDQVWNQMINEIVLENELKDVGLEISSSEVYDMFAGDEVAPFLRQYLVGDGPYNQDQIRGFLTSIINNPNPNNQQIQQLKELEDFAIRYRGQERYLNMVQAGYVGSNSLARQSHIEKNRKYAISYLGVNYTLISDSLVNVSDRDLANYIKEHEHLYEQPAETYVRYARFPILPNVKDSTSALKEANRLKGNFATYQTPQDDSTFVFSRSRIPYSPSTFSPLYQLPPNIRDQVADAEVRDIIGPVLESGGIYRIYKVSATQEAVTPSLKLNHILLNFTPDTADVRAKAADIARQARGGADFAQLATDNSQDFSSKDNGGELGWYSRGAYGPEFDKAVEKASPGSIIGPIKGSRGFHVVQVVDKSNKDYNIAVIEQPIIYSTPTKDSVYGKANYFAQALINTQDINAAGLDQDATILESNGLTKDSKEIIGLNGGRELILWAINSGVGDISKVLRINDNYIVAQVTQKKTKGLKSVEDVRDEILAKVTNEKKAELIKKKLNSLNAQDLNAMKEGYGDGAFISTAENITFSSSSISGIGTDKYIIGRIFGMEQGEISEPIAGDNGVYVIQVTGVTEAAELDETSLATTASQERTSGGFALSQKALPALIDLADVEDTRHEAEARGYGYK